MYKHTSSNLETPNIKHITISKLGKIKERLGLRTNFLKPSVTSFHLLANSINQ